MIITMFLGRIKIVLIFDSRFIYLLQISGYLHYFFAVTSANKEHQLRRVVALVRDA